MMLLAQMSVNRLSAHTLGEFDHPILPQENQAPTHVEQRCQNLTWLHRRLEISTKLHVACASYNQMNLSYYCEHGYHLQMVLTVPLSNFVSLVA